MAVFPFNLKFSAVILMVASLLVGLAFCLGHDAFYQNLNRTPVLDGHPHGFLNSSLNLSDQQVYVALGTFFAFLVKSSLSFSVSTVFDQSAWRTIRGRRNGVGAIDDLLSTLKNALTLFNIHLWKRYPMEMALAVICWLLPVASIISPATLSVKLASFDQQTLMKVPRVDFTSTNFADLTSVFAQDSGWMSIYRSPTAETRRIMKSVAAQGSILPIDPPAVNSSWSLSFHGPGLLCDDVDDAIGAYITENVAQVMKKSVKPKSSSNMSDLTRYGYLSWAPDSESLNGSTPFYQINGSDTYKSRLFRVLGPEMSDKGKPEDTVVEPKHPLVQRAPLSLFVATFPGVLGYSEYDTALENMDKAVQNSTIIRCSLHNSSYQAVLTYINGRQTIHVKDTEVINSVSLFSGTASFNDSSGASSNTSFMQNPQIIESLSYQSLMEAFSSILVGGIRNYLKVMTDGTNETQSVAYWEKPQTGIISTKLMETKEMRSIQFTTGSNTDTPYTEYWNARSVSPSHLSSVPLSEALEELFQNTTLSLMSSKAFQPNYTVNDIPETNVTITSDQNIYVYTRSILWAAYGAAIGATARSIAAGVFFYFKNDGSYSTKFSTIFRVTQGAIVSTDLSPKDHCGLDPLPDHIANAKMTTGFHQDDHVESVDGSPAAHLRHVRHESPAEG
ncbi:unnamed protein product [Penicillium olsonii]|nr:unnamed protein product [Penicillium olsonii]